MREVHFIAMDTHCHSTDICVKTHVGGPAVRQRVDTSIQALRQVIEQVRRPRKLTFEEGPLADWLYRGLRGEVDELVICDPRRNAFVAKDGDKADAIDAVKLCDLYMGGYLRGVHHAESADRQASKQTVGLYHERVENRVRMANKVMGLFRRWGVMVREADFTDPEDREGLLVRLGEGSWQGEVRGHLEMMLAGYDEALREEQLLRWSVEKQGKSNEQVVRWEKMPGIGWVRGMTFFVYVDTPWRFGSKAKLWKYMGIGLVREQSGGSRGFVHVSRACNHRLKSMIMGAAETIIQRKLGVFYRQYESWRDGGMDFGNARRNVARSVSSSMWGMWKSGAEFDESLVGCTLVDARTLNEQAGGGRR